MERAVWPVFVVVAAVDAEDVLEVAAAEDEDPVEAVSADRAHPTFGMSVRVRSLNGRTDHLDPLGVIHCPSDLKVGRATAGRQVPLAASPRGYVPLVLLLAEPHLDFCASY